MGKEDDVIAEGYQYQWSPKSDLSLTEFLTKVRDQRPLRRTLFATDRPDRCMTNLCVLLYLVLV